MKKLFYILARKDIRLKNISEDRCELFWENRGETYLVILSTNGHLSISTKNILSSAEIKEFASIFLENNVTYSSKQSINSTHLYIDKKDFTYDDSFPKLYKQLKKTKGQLASIFDYNK